MTTFVLQGLLLGSAAAFQPGPFQAYVLGTTTRYGWRAAAPAALAPLISDGPILLLVLFFVTRLDEPFLSILRLLGGLLLLYLAYGGLRAVAPGQALSEPAGKGDRRVLAEAVLINGLSPAPYLFWATVAGPILTRAWQLSPGYGMSFLAGFYAALVGGFLAIVAATAVTRNYGQRLAAGLNTVAAGALLLFGLYQIVTAGRVLLGS